MDKQQFDYLSLVTSFISEYGLPTFIIIYLLNSFQKKLDKLVSLVDRMTGVILAMSKVDRGDIDVRDN